MNVYDWYKDNTEYCNDEEQPEMNYIVTEHKTPREQAAFWMTWSLLRSKRS